ncbi:MAG: oxidoreductase [Thermoactinospora sp.]|nr:oxidoreductase [Thermoactinospora sp.]
MTGTTMYEFAGGLPAFQALAAAHHERCLADPVLNHPFSHRLHPEHVTRLAAYLAEVFGGPSSGLDQSTMLDLHARNGMEADLGERFVACFVRAADDAGLPEDPAFRDGLRAYMEWAVGEVLAYNAPDAVVPPGQRTPRWGWDGLELRGS